VIYYDVIEISAVNFVYSLWTHYSIMIDII